MRGLTLLAQLVRLVNEAGKSLVGNCSRIRRLDFYLMTTITSQPVVPNKTVPAEPDSPVPRGIWLGVGILAMGISLAIAWINLDQGWFHTDEGQLGQAAERVLHGELPHRDFDDMYTGALSYLNAFSFHLWGIDSHSMRWMLFVWFMPFVVAIYWLMTRFVPPLVAGVLTVLAAAWTIPMYSASMPSWYNLFFATWALCALMKFLERGHKRYLLLAGLAIGISITFKVSGLFILAAALLLLLYRNQLGSDPADQPNQMFSGLVSLALACASLLSFSFVNRVDPLMQSVHFVLPFLALTVFVLVNEWKMARGGWGKRCREIVFDVVPLAIGVGIPILAFVAIYIRQEAVSDLINGVLVMPKQRLEFTTFEFPRANTLVMVVPLLVLCYPVFLGNVFRAKRERATEHSHCGSNCAIFDARYAGWILGRLSQFSKHGSVPDHRQFVVDLQAASSVVESSATADISCNCRGLLRQFDTVSISRTDLLFLRGSVVSRGCRIGDADSGLGPAKNPGRGRHLPVTIQLFSLSYALAKFVHEAGLSITSRGAVADGEMQNSS